MSIHICQECGTSYPAAPSPPARCPICEDDRQYVPRTGQAWTTPAGLSESHTNTWRRLEPDLFEIHTQPDFAIGQRALLVRTPAGNFLWDCVALIDDATVELIKGLGGLADIAISHPHYYTTCQDWAAAFGCPVHLHAADREWVMRPDPAIRFWDGDTLPPLEAAVADVSAIIHLAAVFRTADDDLIWRSNLDATRNLIAAAKAHAPAARFIMASTSNIYNVTSPRPGREDDAADPQHAYPASKLAAEQALRESGLTWSILRLGFVYGDQDGHLEALPGHAAKLGMHPASRMSLVHHRDVATAARLALNWAMDGRVVNITDEAPTSLYELVELAGGKLEPSSAPLTNPWHLHIDGALARSLGFQPTVRTIHQAAQDKLM